MTRFILGGVCRLALFVNFKLFFHGLCLISLAFLFHHVLKGAFEVCPLIGSGHQISLKAKFCGGGGTESAADV